MSTNNDAASTLALKNFFLSSLPPRPPIANIADVPAVTIAVFFKDSSKSGGTGNPAFFLILYSKYPCANSVGISVAAVLRYDTINLLANCAVVVFVSKPLSNSLVAVFPVPPISPITLPNIKSDAISKPPSFTAASIASLRIVSTGIPLFLASCIKV